MFYDEAKINVRSGDGGDGMISFRQEKFVRLGGPDGGDGGRGGDVMFVATHHLNSLITFQHNRHYRAGNGVHGTVQKMTGAKGDDLRLEAPVGTIIRNAATGDVLADLTEAGQEVVAGQGLVVLEAMKMENEIRAPRAGKIAALRARAGSPVEKGEVLIILE